MGNDLELYPVLCPICSGEPRLLGSLGDLIWLRCQDCGYEWHQEAEAEVDDRPRVIIRFYRDRPKEILRRGLTLEEAQDHCSDPLTSGEGWYDGFDLEENHPE